MQSKLDAEFAALRRLADQHDDRGYPVEFRRRAVGLAAHLIEEGWTQQRIVDALGISRPTLRRWRQKYDGQDQWHVDEPQLQPVEINVSKLGGHKIKVVSPGGWRIEGLGLDQVVELMGRLR